MDTKKFGLIIIGISMGLLMLLLGAGMLFGWF